MTATIYLEEAGSGPPLVLLHGWGLHGGVWERSARELAGRYRVIRPDLPGFGRSAPHEGVWSAPSLAGRLAAALPRGAVWIGWSLGGLLALAAAPSASPARLVLVGSTPRFVQGEGWPHALAASVLEGFAEELERDYRATLLRFLALQARGSERAREELRGLREILFAHGEPAPAALRGGLSILRESDLRPALSKIEVPVLVLHGERDMLVPVAAAAAMAEQLPGGRLALIPGAGHAPFLSHPDLFHGAIRSFLDE